MKPKHTFTQIYIILFISAFLISCQQSKVPKAEIDQLIPPEAAVIMKLYDNAEWQNTIKNQAFLSKYKDNPILNYFSTKAFESIIDIPNEVLWSYNILGKDKLVKTLIFESKSEVQFKTESKQSYKYDNTDIKSFQTKDQSFYLTELGQHTVLSNSKIIVENIIRNYKSEVQITSPIKKYLDILSNDSPSLIVNTERFTEISKTFFKKTVPERILNLTNFIGFDLNVNESEMLFSGIIFKNDDNQEDWKQLSNVESQKSFVAEVIPSHFISATSILVSDYKKLFADKSVVVQTPTNDSLWYNIKELASIKLNNGQAIAIVSKNIDQTFEALKKEAQPLKTFNATEIFSLNNAISSKRRFSKIISKYDFNYFMVYQDMIVGSKNLEVLEDIIIQINNQNVLAQQVNYSNHLESLNTQSHVLWFTALNHQKNFMENQSNPDYKKNLKSIDWTRHELLLSQLIVEDDFAYFNILQKQTPKDANPVNIEQVIRIKSESPMITSPQFFKNWRTGQQDVVYQDVNNKLHLVDTKGNPIWTKQLETPIVGRISSIDIYQNTRIQLVFATQNKVYVLDKNGNEVSPFPMEFKNEITQELSVFDYDKNGRYRFVVVMGNKIRMYNKEGKRVRGFKFKKTKTPLAYPMKHIRIGRKDYILAQEESGQLHILSRTGQSRIDISEDLNHTTNEWFEHYKSFVSVNNEGQILKIDQNGKVSRDNKNWINPKFTANADLLVSMSENQLHINKSTTELPYGVYTQPFIQANRIGIADTQTQKIYVLDKSGQIIEGFPIYGQQITDSYKTRKGFALLCKDENDAALVYRVKFD
ncbi:hypothetical protein [Flavobacteriaceae bacterium 14752]|uniref:hypothetical protein n=1 Tax=Mesohalobacter salilacus TaxID=2491711 RepID=UPI000F63BDB6|nr:hypothetical protein EIG84_02150 [Flavobacteriaceae bacterium 14752]